MFKEKRIITKHDFERLWKLVEAGAREAGRRTPCVERLRAKLSRARLVTPAAVKPSIVTMNSRVKLKDIGNGRDRYCTLVFPPDQEKADECISVLEPMGSELLGHEVGDVIRWQRNTEDCYYLLEAIVYQPEAAGHYHL